MFPKNHLPFSLDKIIDTIHIYIYFVYHTTLTFFSQSNFEVLKKFRHFSMRLNPWNSKNGATLVVTPFFPVPFLQKRLDFFIFGNIAKILFLL